MLVLNHVQKQFFFFTDEEEVVLSEQPVIIQRCSLGTAACKHFSGQYHCWISRVNTLTVRKWAGELARGEGRWWGEQEGLGVNLVIFGLFISPVPPPAAGVKILLSASPMKPVCFRGVCEKWRRGVWDREPKPIRRGVGSLMNRETGLLPWSPRCWSLPSCFACTLTGVFSLVPDLTHVCQLFFFNALL